jgi:DNA polymerase I-like protein with 3'-5' exonuclease and polymerase domains
VSEAVSTGGLVMPTGRIYKFTPDRRPDGTLKWPRTRIVNYPVQGLGHDLTTIARVSLYKRIKNSGISDIYFVSTVHDSVVLDFQLKDLSVIRPIVASVFDDLPNNFHRLFRMEFNLPIRGELSIGKNLLDMEEVL